MELAVKSPLIYLPLTTGVVVLAIGNCRMEAIRKFKENVKLQDILTVKLDIVKISNDR